MATWSKKTYQMVAKLLNSERQYAIGYCDKVKTTAAHNTIYDLAGNFATTFAADNPRFDRERFMQAISGGDHG